VKVYFIPRTVPGKWSIRLIFAFIVLFSLFQILVATGQRGGATFFSNLILAVPIVIAGICGVASFFTGLVGVIKSRERSILVYIAMIIGLCVLLFILGEIIFPH